MTTMMEVTSHLKTVLKNYQHSATKSLQGPGLALVADKCDGLPEIKEDDFLQPTLPPVQQIPILTTADTTCSERTETILEGETISCFVVGGEKRLCLPQLLNSVLVDFSLMQINQECDQLQIYCSRCTPEQLNVLKNQGILPSSAPSCGLITKTDAERLCSALLHNQVTLPLRPRKGAVTFSVYHECFGKCMGFCTPELYTGKGARCIECSECHRAYSPQQFVCHVHGNHETRTVHWGFDSTMWRSYLYVYKDQLDREWHVKFLDEMRDQFKGKMPFPAPVVDNNAINLKRKQMLHPDITKLEFGDIPHKRNKLEDYTHINMNQLYLEPLYLHYIQEQYNRQLLSSFKPIGHVLKEGRIRHAVKYSDPPVLQNPERVVHLSQSENYEGGFQPNVALAPSKKIKYAPVKPEKIEEKDEVSSTRNGTVVTNTSVIRHDKDNDHQDRTSPNAQKSPESHNVIDSTVSVVQSTGNFPRYNPEIELSTDTDDSGSEISEKSDLMKLQELTKDLDVGVRERILDIVKNMVKEHELLLQDRRNKDTKIDELSGHIVELEKQLDELHISQSCHRLSPLKNGYADDTHNTSDVEDKISLVTTSADNHNSPTESREVVEDSATSREDAVQQKTVIASLDHQGVEEAIIKTEPE